MSRLRSVGLVTLWGVLGALATVLAQGTPGPVSPESRAALAPLGALRAGINHGNPLLATRDLASGELRGVAVDLARELARRVGVPLELVPFGAAGPMGQAARAGLWDVAFLGIDPERATDISFTAPYVEVEGTYLVRPGSPLRSVDEVDRPGVRIVVTAGSAYDLFLRRSLKAATIVRAPTTPQSIDLFVEGDFEALAAVRPALVSASPRIPGSHVMTGRFMTIPQAAGVPTGRPLAARYVREFVEEVKASGFVAAALRRHGVEGQAVVSPPAPLR